MDNKEFDQILKARFTNQTLQEQGDSWQKLSAMLPAAPKKRRALTYWKIAASVLLLLGLGAGFSVLFQKQNKNAYPSPLETTGNQNILRATEANHSSKEGDHPSSNQELASTSALISRTKKNIAGTNTTNASTLPGSYPTKDRNKPDIATATPAIPQAKDNISSRQPVSGVNGKTEQNSLLTNLQPRDHQVAKTALHEAVPATSISSTENTFNPGTHRATAIAFGGGMNYGVLNTGYNVNISAKHALNKHIFVESSIAFLYNSQAEKSSFYAAQNFSPTRPAPGQVSASKTTNPAASNFYYLSVNPTMGYQINKIIALSAGPDLQQRIAALGQNGTSIYTPGSDPRIVPQLDLGFTGKADFLISPKIETSILFRNGLSNLLKKPDLHPYLNRRYIQVQLNYNFLLGQ